MQAAKRAQLRNLRQRHSLAVAAMLLSTTVQADRLTLADGSELVGELLRVGQQNVTFRTGFAGELKIDRQQVVGIQSEGPVITALGDGSRLVGRLDYTPDRGQAVVSELVGPVTIPPQQFSAAWRPDQKSPETLRLERAEAEHARRVEELRAAQREPHELWSGSAAFGLVGAEGNTEKQNVNGKLTAKRETDFDRLYLSLEGRSASDQGQQTEAEVIAEASLERDFTDRWFTFGKAAFERDKFEDIDLRATLSTGMGYFLIKEPDHEWKPRAGIGYQFEAPENGENEGEFVFTLGYDYWIKLFGDTRIGHTFTYIPTIEQPGTDYRAESELSVKHPLKGNDAWNVGVSLKHQYDAMPPVGVEKLDTIYKFNVGYEFD